MINNPNTSLKQLLEKSRQSQKARAELEEKHKDYVESAFPLPKESIKLPPPEKKQNKIILKIKQDGQNTPTPVIQETKETKQPEQPKKVSLLDLIEKSKEQKKIKTSRDVLFGTGLTKKLLEKQQRDIEKEATLQKPEIALKKITPLTVKIEPEPQPPIIQIQTPTEIVWDEYQLAALKGLRHDKYGCLIGAAGTGKTTVTKQIVKELEHLAETIDLNKVRLEKDKTEEAQYAPAIAFCAFTGRAVQQMKRNLPRSYWGNCATIHATLGYAPIFEEKFDEKLKKWRTIMRFVPTFTAQNKLPYKILVMDESGMTPIPLWNELIAALLPACKIILIGDINQLPPVQGRSVLGFAMLEWPTYTLEHIHRQAADNPIIANAHRILKGIIPVKDKKAFSMITLPPGSIKASNAIFEAAKKLHDMGMFDPKEDALIVPQNKDMIGQISLNEKMVHYFNKPRIGDDMVQYGHRQLIGTGAGQVHFAVGDKVMLLQNDRKRGLTNGMTGFVVSINANGNFDRSRGNLYGVQHNATLDVDALDDLINGNTDVDDNSDLDMSAGDKEDENQRQATHIMTVRFEIGTHVEEVTFSTSGQYKTVTLAYAFTCHKSQGGEYRNVIIVVHSANARMLCREWLYTAVTRAKERVILLYNDRGLMQALNNQRIKGKTVKEKAEHFLALQDKKDTTLPILPKATRV